MCDIKIYMILYDLSVLIKYMESQYMYKTHHY